MKGLHLSTRLWLELDRLLDEARAGGAPAAVCKGIEKARKRVAEYQVHGIDALRWAQEAEEP